MTPPAEATLDAALLMQIQELVHVGTWVWDVETDTVHWSDELFRLFGVEPQSIPLRRETYMSFVHERDKERVGAIVSAALAAQTSFEFDHTIVKRGGEPRVLYCRGNVVCETDSVIRMIGASIDITDRIRQQEALQASEERFRSVFDQSAVGMVITDSEKVIVRVNPSFARLLGYEPAELVGRTVFELTHPGDRDMTHRTLKRHELDRDSFSYEKRYLHRNGDSIWGRATVTRLRFDDGSPDGFMGVIEDITESKRASEALNRQTELLQSIMDHLPVMISMFDATGRPIFVNREWQRTFGWTLEEAESIDLFSAIYPDREQQERARVTILGGGAKWNDFEPHARDGHKIPSSWACISLSDGTCLTIGQDITERRMLEQRLLQSQKMEALGQLAGGVAHDFNNLLTVISACATFVMEEVGSKTGVADDVREIIAASNRAAALTRQLLAFSRRQMLRPEIVNVNEAIQTITKTLGRLIGENIQLAIVPAATTPSVEVDPHQLEQVVLNLAVNARDAIQDNGTITIETLDCPRAPNDPNGRDHVVITVADDGAGIEPSIRDRIFEPFFTTKSIGHGTGLGLATVHGIVEQSGGHIEVDSTVGVGTVFRVFLPVSAACAKPTTNQQEGEQLRGAETVLLVEDEAAVRAVARRVLIGLGYTVLEARHGADAARLSAKHAGPIHLLITDVIMPEMGGRELARLVRKERQGMPVLYISGYTDDELLRKGILEPGAELLRKPFLPAELARTAKQLLHAASLAN